MNTQQLKVWVLFRARRKGEGPAERGLKVASQQRGGHGELIGKEGEAARWWEFWSCLGRQVGVRGERGDGVGLGPRLRPRPTKVIRWPQKATQRLEPEERLNSCPQPNHGPSEAEAGTGSGGKFRELSEAEACMCTHARGRVLRLR